MRHGGVCRKYIDSYDPFRDAVKEIYTYLFATIMVAKNFKRTTTITQNEL